MVKIYKYKFFFIVLALCQFGCAKYTLVYNQKDFNPDNLGWITVLPVSDRRVEVYETVNFKKETTGIERLIKKKLKEKGYSIEIIRDPAVLENIQPTQIPFLDTDSISKIGPSDASWVLLPVVVALKNFKGVTAEYAEIVCFLYEKTTGELVWEGSARYSGAGAMDTNIIIAAEKLMDDFPSKK